MSELNQEYENNTLPKEIWKHVLDNHNMPTTNKKESIIILIYLFLLTIFFKDFFNSSTIIKVKIRSCPFKSGKMNFHPLDIIKVIIHYIRYRHSHIKIIHFH